MSYITIEKIAADKVKAKAEIDGKEYQAEFSDMMLAVIWAEELFESDAASSADSLPQGEGFIPSAAVRRSPSPYNKGRLAGGMSLTARGGFGEKGSSDG